MKLKTEFRLAIQVLTPLHIGTGRDLEEGFDYVVRGERTLRLHEERFVRWVAERGEAFARLTQGVPPGQILDAEIPRELVRYELPGVPQGPKEIRECVKDAYDRPYLPGSALKGALRTLLLDRAWKERRLALSRVRLDPEARFAARRLEQEVFGPTPHEDLLKALRLQDSAPAPMECLRLLNVRCVSPAARAGIPIALEALAPKTVLMVEGHIDETAFRPWGFQRKPGFLPEEKRAWLAWEALAAAARERAQRRLELDLDWAQKVGVKTEPWEQLLQQVRQAERGESRGFPLQIGFGTGWLGTTLGPVLLADPGFPEVHRRYKLGRVPRSSRQTPPERFPASRRLARLNALDLPLGWVWVLPKETA